LANVYESGGNFKEALQCLKKCIEIYDKNAMTYAHVGRVYDKMGNIKEAMNYYRKCNQIRSDIK
jgi:tetratricopeptide (TPR) repeat protein